MLRVLLLRGLRNTLHSLKSTAAQRLSPESGQKVRSGQRLEFWRGMGCGNRFKVVSLYSGCGACHWQAEALGLGKAWRELGLSPPSTETPPMETIALTDKEQALFDSISEGMDAPGCGWLHELDPFNNDHVAAGVLGALIAKGLVHSHQERTPAGYPPAYWVELV